MPSGNRPEKEREDDDMNEVGSGGIGAVSFGISEAVVEVVVLLLLVLLAFGAWKVVKLLLVAFKG